MRDVCGFFCLCVRLCVIVSLCVCLCDMCVFMPVFVLCVCVRVRACLSVCLYASATNQKRPSSHPPSQISATFLLNEFRSKKLFKKEGWGALTCEKRRTPTHIGDRCAMSTGPSVQTGVTVTHRPGWTSTIHPRVACRPACNN